MFTPGAAVTKKPSEVHNISKLLLTVTAYHTRLGKHRFGSSVRLLHKGATIQDGTWLAGELTQYLAKRVPLACATPACNFSSPAASEPCTKTVSSRDLGALALNLVAS